jgi:hypothetical protein
LPKIAKGSIVFWLALSEPNAGSDLLALQTKAEERGDVFACQSVSSFLPPQYISLVLIRITHHVRVPGMSGQEIFADLGS